MSPRRLLTNPFLARELELRASGDPSYRPFDYSGPAMYLHTLLVPLAYGAAVTWGSGEREVWGGPLFLVTVWLLSLYFSHASARVCAGSLAIERERGTLDALRLTPRPLADLLVGKYVAAIAPLLVESVLLVPLLGMYAVFGSIAWSTIGLVVVVELGLVLGCGMIGIFWSLHSVDVVSALSHAFGTVLTVNTLPLVGAILMRLSHDVSLPALLQLSPLGLVTRLVHIEVVTAETLLRDAGAVALFAVVTAGCAILLYRASLRRMASC